MKKKLFLKIFLFLFVFCSCAYTPIYKKNSVFSHKINILVKSNDYDKKIPLLMKASLRGENQQMAILSPTPNVMTESGGGMTDLRK